MATVEEVVRDLLGSTATSAGAPLAAAWLNNRYRELVSEVRFRHLRKVGELVLPARVTDGTLSATRGSAAVTGDATAAAAWLVSPGALATNEYWFLRPSSAWYKLSALAGAAITLGSAFAEEDVAAGGYTLVKRYHALATNARWLGTFTHTRLRRAFKPLPFSAFDAQFPGRVITGSYPMAVAQVGVNASNVLMVEVYPPPATSEILHYIYWDLPTALTISSTIPAQVEAYTLKEGALVDLYRYEFTKALRAGQVEVAATWRNEMNAQETKWANRKSQARAADRGADDTTFILNTLGSNSSGGYQRTARDMVADRWSWPGTVSS